MQVEQNPTYHRLSHGGRLRAAAKQYDIPLPQWVDLSTGIAPQPWPISALPSSCWARLPEDDDGLLDHARNYYGAKHVLPVAGSQAAILALPRLRSACRVGVIAGSYEEHALAWQLAGHKVHILNQEEIERTIADLDVLILINPDNPSAVHFSSETLVTWHERLAKKGGWLIVDEAFIDATPEASIARLSHKHGLIVLRSLGKFFGLAGARVGFVCAHPEVLDRLDLLLGPWTISGPARTVAAQALADTTWQNAQRKKLQAASQWLRELLTKYALAPAAGCALFQYVPTQQAKTIHVALAHCGVFTRLFEEPSALRFGLPNEGIGWARLEMALRDLTQRERC